MAPQWYEHPSLVLQVANLAKLRNDLRDNNLFEADGMRPNDPSGEPPSEVLTARTSDGTWNDLGCPAMGAKGTGFGRNVPVEMMTPDLKRLLEPDPRRISNELMARDTFKPAGIINALAAAWLQFENHNCFFHGDGVPGRNIEIPIEAGDDFGVAAWPAASGSRSGGCGPDPIRLPTWSARWAQSRPGWPVAARASLRRVRHRSWCARTR